VRWLLPIVRGWANYSGRFNPAALHQALRMVDELLVRWARRKYKSVMLPLAKVWDTLAPYAYATVAYSSNERPKGSTRPLSGTRVDSRTGLMATLPCAAYAQLVKTRCLASDIAYSAT
jgi:group II intron maturase